LIPPLLGFYGKFLIINALSIHDLSSSLSFSSFTLILIIIITSIISCSKYLNIIQLTSFNFNPLLKINVNQISLMNPLLASLISILTMFILLSFLKPIYLISIFTY